MPDLLRETISVRYVLISIVIAISCTFGAMQYISSCLITKEVFQIANAQVKQNTADVVDLKLIIAQNKIIIANTVDMVKDVRDRYVVK